jgi:hypothetical protein
VKLRHDLNIYNLKPPPSKKKTYKLSCHEANDSQKKCLFNSDITYYQLLTTECQSEELHNYNKTAVIIRKASPYCSKWMNCNLKCIKENEIKMSQNKILIMKKYYSKIRKKLNITDGISKVWKKK